jgi:tripartite-type tricarboxylate transporter receptor subunit TctC
MAQSSSTRFFNRRLALHGIGLAVAGLVSASALAQTYPSKTVTMVVPWPAGGPSDFVARQIQPDMQKALGQTLVIENIGGVGGAMGVQKMLNAPADGYQMTLGSPLELVIAPIALATVKYKPEDVRLVAQMVKAPMVLIARKDLPAANMDELIAMASKPGAKEWTFANPGPGSMFHLAAEKLGQQTGLKFVHIPYKGSAPMMNDLMGGQVDMALTIFAGPIPGMIANGKLKALGITTAEPLAKFPQLAALAAHPRLKGFEFDSWAGLQVPRKTPDDVAQRINQAANAAMKNTAVRKAFEDSGNLIVAPMSLAELDRTYAAEVARYQGIAKSINFQPQ